MFIIFFFLIPFEFFNKKAIFQKPYNIDLHLEPKYHSNALYNLLLSIFMETKNMMILQNYLINFSHFILIMLTQNQLFLIYFIFNQLKNFKVLNLYVLLMQFNVNIIFP